MSISMRYLVAGALAASVFMSAISVVYVKHQSRKQFVELERLKRDRDGLQTEWNRLQLEYGAWATHDRIEGVASARLQFHTPPTESVVLVTR